MNSLGIYFGPKFIGLVETKGRKLISKALIPQYTASAGDLEAIPSAEDKTSEITGLLREELKKSNIDSKEATLCLSGKDLIIRIIEMPLMSREELQSAISFEVKKYIPFKVEDLISDSQTMFDRQGRTNLVLFIGIKKETLDKYISIFNKLNIKIKAIEYSAYSILRCLKLANSSDKGINGILAVDILGKDEVNFTVLENGFPLFSRDIALISEMGDLGVSEEKSIEEVLDKLKSEIRVSLDYYRRKFSAKEVKKIFLLASQEHRQSLEAIIREMGLDVYFIDVARRVDKSVPYSLSFLKGYCASLSKVINTNIKINLLAAKEKSEVPVERAFQKEAESLLKDLKLDPKFIVLGVFICIAAFFLGFYRTVPLRKELESITNNHSPIVSASPMAKYEDLTAIKANFKTKIEAIDDLIKNQVYVTEPLGAIASAMPKGAWLTDFTFSNQQPLVMFNLNGIVYLKEGDKEFEAVNKFISNLRENPDFTKYFKEIRVRSIDRRELNKLTVTYFTVYCSNS